MNLVNFLYIYVTFSVYFVSFIRNALIIDKKSIIVLLPFSGVPLLCNINARKQGNYFALLPGVDINCHLPTLRNVLSTFQKDLFKRN